MKKIITFLILAGMIIISQTAIIVSLNKTPTNLKTQISDLRHEKEILVDSISLYKEKLSECEKWLSFIEKSYFVTATVYNAEQEQCNNDYLTTASGFKLSKTNQYRHKIIAVSRDLLEFLPFGTKVYIFGTDYDGVYTVQDVMNKRFKKRIDILINKEMPIGKWNNVLIKKL